MFDVMDVGVFVFDVNGSGKCSLWLVVFGLLLVFDGGDIVCVLFVSVDNMIEQVGVLQVLLNIGVGVDELIVFENQW